MSMQKKRPQSGPDAPLTAERKQYRRLMAQGVKFQVIRFWRRCKFTTITPDAVEAARGVLVVGV